MTPTRESSLLFVVLLVTTVIVALTVGADIADAWHRIGAAFTLPAPR